MLEKIKKITTKKTTKSKIAKTRVIIFGTFDGLHKGHENFFKQARNLAKNSHLTVSIARDLNVKKIKGKIPFFNEKKRAQLVKKSKLVNKVILGGLKNHIPHILKERPDIVGLGYDQYAYVKNLKNNLKNKLKNIKPIKIVRLKPYKEKIYKNSLIHAKK